MLHNTGDLHNRIAGSLQISNTLLEIQINDIVAIVSDIRLSLFAQSFELCNVTRFLKEILKSGSSELPTKLNNFNGHSQTATTNIVNEFELIDGYNELLASTFNHHFPQVGATAALDEVKVRINFVGTVNGEINDRVRVHIRQGDPEREGLLVRLLGSGDSDDVLELALMEKLANSVDDVFGSGASSEVVNHTGFDVLNGFIGDDFLLIVLDENELR
ncbi:hypothetical protein AHAS_Ahas04G0180300 [Arachis hypogaea]